VKVQIVGKKRGRNVDNSERITAAEQSLTFVLFAASQVARNLRMLIPGGDVTAQSPEEQALYLEQAAFLDRLFQTISLTNDHHHDLGRIDKLLAKIIADCDARAEKLPKEHLDRRIKELKCRLSFRPIPVEVADPEVAETLHKTGEDTD
jgi:hypothetical protein